HLSEYHQWEQKTHATEWLLFTENIGTRLSIDETALTKDELYTILTNKEGKGGPGSIVSMVEDVKPKEIIAVLKKIPLARRLSVEEVTCDLSNSMQMIIHSVFHNATIVADRFHVQKLVIEALQQIRIKEKHRATKEETEAVKEAKKKGKIHIPRTYENGDTKKQLLSRSFHLLFKPSNKWGKRQQKRAEILFKEFPQIEKAYKLVMEFRSFYEYSKTKKEAKKRLDNWYKRVNEEGFEDFIREAEYLKTREDIILNYFENRSTNASAESFNAKLKGFRTVIRGVRDKALFLYRISKLYG
ncbi:transposase, partial [Patescibacteria group bacterium]|nr:transposase [Patescibacteria group bacterium]MCG2687544.1 transposase [Candidatus Parcubacteria bacterium]